jgi:galactose-1-phosphate uridylyltransferase
MSQQLDRETLANILQAENVEGLSFPELVSLFQEEKGISKSLPDGVYQIDPRNGDRIIYHSSRARRPHDNRPSPSSDLEFEQQCVICQGHTTGIIDVADLSQGFTFINKNLFPILYPLGIDRSNHLVSGGVQAPVPEGRPSYGFHFLQWTSSQHDRDWHNMPLSDNVVVMKRLAALEKKLLTDSGGFMPATETWGDLPGRHGFVLIIKNYGHLVGGSLSHGHQQIAFSNVMPRRIWDDWCFEREKGEPFSAYLLRETPSELIIRDYGPATLLVPYFMRRPFDMMLLLKDTSRKYICELTEAEIAAVAEGWHDATQAIRLIMPEIGREIAYNVTTHNGPGAGLYFEFLPYTQEIGGVEHLGLFVCQGNPKSVAARIRELLSS